MNTFIERSHSEMRQIHEMPILKHLHRWCGRVASKILASSKVVECAVILSLALFAPSARADTVASLLGDFTINQFCGLQLATDSVKIHYTIVFGQLPALRELHQADANGDGVTTQEERDAYVSGLAPGLAKQLDLAVDGTEIPLRATSWTSSLPKEQSGFSMRLDIDYVGDLPPLRDAEAVHSLKLANKNFPGRIGWHEIVMTPSAGQQVFDTNSFSSSLTGGLNDALQALPASGPLDEREVHMSFTRGAAPAGSKLLASRDGVSETARASAPADNAWLAVQTRRLIELISTPNVPVHIIVLAILAATLLGALHALSPGHGKSIVGAYLVGSRGTPRHAVFLGITVTITHTLVVFALGLATLFASQFILPERVFPVLSLLSGLLVLGMGLVLLAQRWKSARFQWLGASGNSAADPQRTVGLTLSPAIPGQHGHAMAYRQTHDHEHPSEQLHSHEQELSARESLGHVHAHDHDHDHDHGHVHAHPHDHGHAHGHDHGHGHDAHAHGMTHSHGGSTHSHMPPGADGQAVSWRGLLALGVSGGLLPCPSAMVLLLAAVALNKTLFGLVLVVAFSVGLAMTLIAVGLLFLYARNRFQSRIQGARWTHLIPVLSAASITILGAFLCAGALIANPL